MTEDESATKSKSTPGMAGPASDRFLWKVQMGAFVDNKGPDKRMLEIKNIQDRLLDNRDAEVTTTTVNGREFRRVRILGLTEAEAKKMGAELKKNGIEVWIIPPTTPIGNRIFRLQRLP